MRLTIINQFFPPDLAPTAHLAASLAHHRAELGDEVTVITGRSSYVTSGGTANGTDADHPVRVIRVATPGGGKSSVVTRLAGYLGFHVGALVRLIGLPRQDVIVSLTTPPYIVAGPMLARVFSRRTRVILWSMDVYPDAAERFDQVDPAGAVSHLLRRVNRWIYPRLDHLVALDEPMAELLVDQYGSRGKPLTSVIPNWEPSSMFPADATVEPWAGYREADLAGRSVVAYIGNTGTGHRFDTVVAAAAHLDAERDAFLFVGGGVRWAELEAAAIPLSTGHGAPLVLHGYLDKSEIPGVLAGARATLITLDDDALGVMSPSKLHASLGMGRPVIYVGPPRSNVDAAIERFDCGFSLRHGDVDGLVDAVRRLRDDDSLHARLSANARRAFDEAHSDTVALPRFDGLIDRS
ncbi:MAG: glycosyltransferase family 4 protein [Acidimicrobiales bacterium]|nr:glycosyltransferase family 4 protein [Acidimicrobiales bacterium]